MGIFYKLENLNQETQPQKKFEVFNNWDVIPRGWYYLFQSREIKKGQVKTVHVGHQKLVVFRTQTGKVHTLDSFCPHMGADLSIGRVKGEHLQCFFHHWEYDSKGESVYIPCLKDGEKKDVKINSYATIEKYGAIWCYPDTEADRSILEVPDLEGKETVTWFDHPNTSQSHHHISMINGIDPQHLATVHDLDIQMDLNVSEDRTHITFILEGETPKGSFVEKVMHLMIGDHYSYAMKYADACLASLTLLRNVYFLKRSWVWPRLHMFYAYRPGVDGKSYTFPIYIAEKYSGLFGGIKSWFRLWLTKRLYYFLKDEDEIIYENIRFSPNNLLPMDSPVVRYLAYVNRLKPSKWSRTKCES